MSSLCLLTIHGIGFQQPPGSGPDGASTPGYADPLHHHLQAVLTSGLGCDPDRPAGTDGPVYVMSAKPGTSDTEWGLGRLGTWHDGQLDISGVPLTANGEPVAHVALVYSPLEGAGPRLGTGAGTIGEAGLLLGHYASAAGAFRMAAGDAWAAIRENRAGPGATASPSLRPRQDLAGQAPHPLAGLLAPASGDSGSAGIVRTLEDDVIAYVCRNDLRERIREFISEAVRRLLARPDIAGVAVNAHSQGTVAAFDVLRQRPAGAGATVRALVTAGSPLRKYADLFSWGTDAGWIQGIPWLNFWDPRDPVADPLGPSPAWRPDDHCASGPGPSLLFTAADDHGGQHTVTVDDQQVDNLRHSGGGGLRAHNYFDNQAQFIPALAGLLNRLAH
jgi:hypothetical protein